MSGTPCLIIIRGNRAQANTRTAMAGPMSTVTVMSANDLIGGFQSLCQLGTTTYDGAEVMTDAQQVQATDIMGAYNTTIEPLLVNSHATPSAVAAVITAALGQVNALLDAVLANP